MSITPYLVFDGRCREAFETYARVLGGTIDGLMTFADSPQPEHNPPGSADLVMHARLTVRGAVLMGSDAPPQMREPMSGIYVSLQVEDPAEAERIFSELSAGGSIRMPLAQTFWARRFGMCVDRFGTPWMINCE